ncbi:MAG: hypothetical protein V4547_18230 [Bacteroidota bacterium]
MKNLAFTSKELANSASKLADSIYSGAILESFKTIFPTFEKNELIIHRKYGIVYRVYGKNSRNKTYHIIAVFVPKIATDLVGESIDVGGKFNVSFRNAGNYESVTNIYK